jgi:murein DD-endopeptidase MepM/ murein hydrolase activator NlpD
MKFSNFFILIFFGVMAFSSCTTSKNPLFSRRSAHEKYGDAIKNAGLGESVMARAWFGEAQKSLTAPVSVSIPYKETGYFSSEDPAASGYLLQLKTGQKLQIFISSNPVDAVLFTELWRPSGDGYSLLKSIDTSDNRLEYVVTKDGSYIVRIQPELLANVEYTVSITTGPSLAFPVDKSGKPKIISTWGVARDAGARSHEGVDIAAKFRTPALAATDGVIGSVTENNLGGKVVFLFDPSTKFSLYYAHLDSQISHPGQRVKAGDTVGLVGNTGNAINTVPRLHFGIYTNHGAIDPLAFIKEETAEPKAVTASLAFLHKWLHTKDQTNLHEGPSDKSNPIKKLSENEAVHISSATDNLYRVELTDGTKGFVSSKDLSDNTISRKKAENAMRVVVWPDTSAAAKGLVPKDESYEILGISGDFYLAKYQSLLGWVRR